MASGVVPVTPREAEQYRREMWTAAGDLIALATVLDSLGEDDADDVMMDATVEASNTLTGNYTPDVVFSAASVLLTELCTVIAADRGYGSAREVRQELALGVIRRASTAHPGNAGDWLTR